MTDTGREIGTYIPATGPGRYWFMTVSKDDLEVILNPVVGWAVAKDTDYIGHPVTVSANGSVQVEDGGKYHYGERLFWAPDGGHPSEDYLAIAAAMAFEGKKRAAGLPATEMFITGQHLNRDAIEAQVDAARTNEEQEEPTS
jgi:hypothetical protein